MEKKWCVYILRCLDGTYYTGVSNDVDKRMKAHMDGKGSKYVCSRGFGELLGVKECEDKIEAFREEWRIKQLPRQEKLGAF